GELLAHTYHHLFATRVACLRFFTVYGPRQRPDLAIRKFAERMIAGEDVPVFGDGSSGRDYTYVDDIVEGIIRAIERARGFHIWTLGGSQPVLLRDLIAKLATALDVLPRHRHLPMQAGDVERTWADITKAKAELAWEPRTSFDDGLAKFVAWLKTERSGS